MGCRIFSLCKNRITMRITFVMMRSKSTGIPAFPLMSSLLYRLIVRKLQRLFLIFFLFYLCPGLYSQGMISDSIDITHYSIHLTDIRFASKEISAYTSLNMTSRQPAITGVCLELLSLQVDSIFVDSAKIASFSHNDTLIRFDLPVPLTPADTVEVRVYYQGKPHVEAYNWGGFHFQGTEYVYNLGIAIADIPHNYGKVWFPCVDDFRDRATYDCHITVPPGYVAVCGGELENITSHSNGNKTYSWSLSQSIPTYLASVAVASYIGIHDTVQAMNGPLPTAIYVRPADSLKAVQSFIHLNQIINIFEQHFGPYPWSRVGFVAAPKGAMEHVTNITYPRAQINGNLSAEYLIAHELSHMWFGNLVTCDNAGDMWLNEGWASFCEFIYREGLYGVADRKSYVRNKLRNILQNLHVQENGYYPLTNMPLDMTYSTTVYTKGACVVHSLRGYMGDSLFFPAVRAYLDSFAHRHATTQDLMNTLTAHSGINLQSFFDAWVDSPGYLHYRVDSFRVLPLSMPPMFSVEVNLRQAAKGPAQTALNNKVELLFMNAYWQTFRTVVTFNGPSDQVVVEVPFIPSVVFVDPEEKLCDATTDELRMIRSPGKQSFPEMMFEAEVIHAGDSAILQAGHQWVPPDPLYEAKPGFRLSNYRYWTVKGVFPASFTAKGKFFFSRFSNLDGQVILSPYDSVVLMYRPGPGLMWQTIPFMRDGLTYQGWLITDSLKQGEYTIGVWDQAYLETGEQQEKAPLRIFPNPSDGSFHFQRAELGQDILYLRISGQSGQVVARHTWEPAQSQWTWQAGREAAGSYMVELYDRQGSRLYATTLVRI